MRSSQPWPLMYSGIGVVPTLVRWSGADNTLLARAAGALLPFARKGDDIVAVHSMDLTRDFDDPRSLVQTFTKPGIRIARSPS
jgi:hypothetical protein